MSNLDFSGPIYVKIKKIRAWNIKWINKYDQFCLCLLCYLSKEIFYFYSSCSTSFLIFYKFFIRALICFILPSISFYAFFFSSFFYHIFRLSSVLLLMNKLQKRSFLKKKRINIARRMYPEYWSCMFLVFPIIARLINL